MSRRIPTLSIRRRNWGGTELVVGAVRGAPHFISARRPGKLKSRKISLDPQEAEALTEEG